MPAAAKTKQKDNGQAPIDLVAEKAAQGRSHGVFVIVNQKGRVPQSGDRDHRRTDIEVLSGAAAGRSDRDRQLPGDSHHAHRSAGEGRQSQRRDRRPKANEWHRPRCIDKAERGEQLRRDGVIIRTWDLMKTYVMGDQTIHAVAGHRYRDQEGRIRRHHGSVGLRQIDADEPDRLPGHAHRRGCTT